uniref:DDE Tnp4 domain-containing protein n=1 Tax=Knipowitschia caucasica TaxID=637954 RepID=A0AAV2MHJ3_KNICA
MDQSIEGAFRRRAQRRRVFLQLAPLMEKQDTHFRLGVPLQQRVAIAVRKLATNADHSSISHLFGVSRSTAYAAKLKEMEGRWRCLLKRNDCKTGLVRSMILTCCVLHNLCESHGEDFKGDWENPVHIDQPHA